MSCWNLDRCRLGVQVFQVTQWWPGGPPAVPTPPSARRRRLGPEAGAPSETRDLERALLTFKLLHNTVTSDIPGGRH